MAHLIVLTDGQKEAANSPENRYFTWLALGKPNREVTTEEAYEHYLRQIVTQPMSMLEFYRTRRGSLDTTNVDTRAHVLPRFKSLGKGGDPTSALG